MKEVVIAGFIRTAQSRSRPNDPGKDLFARMRADELCAKLLPEVIKRTGIEAKEIDDFIVGSAQGVGEQWMYGGRTPLWLANLPDTIPAKFVDQQCGSSMASVHMGFMEIAQGFADIVMLGGIEHMTRIPMDVNGPIIQKGIIAVNQALFSDPQYAHWDMTTGMVMGLTVEKVISQTDFTREDLDRWSVRSHQLAAKAQAEGFFKDEILPIEAEQGDGSIVVVDTDQTVRGDTTLDAMAKLKPVFKKDGVITAGNASPLNAGASAMILMSKETALKKGIRPMATIRSIGFAGVHPVFMSTAPVPAVKRVLAPLKMKVSDIDYWEINEAFSFVPIYAIKELGIDSEKVNVMGGGISIGHPLGATGIRITGTLSRILEKNGARWGCATACCGGGQGVATIIEREM